MPRVYGVVRQTIAAAVAGACITPAVAGAQAASPWRAPAPTAVRYDEDWSGLTRSGAGSERWSEALKNVHLGASDVRLTAGLEIRLRSETFRDNLWGDAA